MDQSNAMLDKNKNFSLFLDKEDKLWGDAQSVVNENEERFEFVAFTVWYSVFNIIGIPAWDYKCNL